MSAVAVQPPLVSAPGNADQALHGIRPYVYVGVDFVGTGRQGLAAGQAVTTLLPHSAHTVQATANTVAAAKAAAIGAVAIPCALVITGITCAATGILWTLPDARADLSSINEELEKATDVFRNALKAVRETPSTDPESPERVHLKMARKRIDELLGAREISALGVLNHSLYITMGLAQTAAGITGVLSNAYIASHVPFLSHAGAPLLAGHVASGAAMGSGIGLGVVYTVRGADMIYRSTKSYMKANAFHEAFRSKLGIEAAVGGWEAYKGKWIVEKQMDDAIAFIKDEERCEEAYMKRHMDLSCLTDEDGTTYTSEGIKKANGEVKAYQSDTEKAEYLKRVDKAIYTQKLHQKISMIIGVAMFVGGVTTIVLSAVFSGGLALVIVGLVAAIFFIAMEGIFATYDSSTVFKKIRDALYSRFNALDFGCEDADQPKDDSAPDPLVYPSDT